MLAGPGTGKTTTLVEAIVDRIEHRGADPSSVLALTFSRKAAEQLRDRVTARLGRTLSSPISSTFHSFAYGLVRSHAPAELYAAPLRLLSAPEQDVLIQELLTGPESLTWPEPLRAAVRTRGFAAEVQAVLARAREKGLDPVDLAELGRSSGDEAYVVAAGFMQRYLVVLDDMSAVDYADLIRRAVGIAEHNRDELRARYSHVFVDEYQDTDPSQVALLQALAGDGRNLVVVGDPDQSIYGFRGADVNGILRFPSSFPASTRRAGPGGRAAYDAPLRLTAADGVPDRGRLHRRPRRHRPHRLGGVPVTDGGRRPTWATAGSTSRRSTPPGPRPSTSPTCSVVRISSTTCPGPRWPCWCGRDAPRCRRCAGRSPLRACRSRWPATTRPWFANRP